MSIQQPLLQATHLTIQTPSSRELFRELHLSMGYEKVAVIGRNGVGKSTLLEVLAGHSSPSKGLVRCDGLSILVSQHLSHEETRETLQRWALEEELHRLEEELEALGLASYDALLSQKGWSYGQRQKLALLDAWIRRPDLLLLDEPTADLDGAGRDWVVQRLKEWEGGLVVVSHDISLLQHFEHFFVVSEAGGRYLQGRLEDVENMCQEWNAKQEKRYLHSLQTLEEREWHNARVCRRRARKKNLGRIHETGRCPSRALLNTNRSYAQMSQGRAAKLRKQRQEQVRRWAKSTRRALDITLALELPILELPATESVCVSLQGVSHSCGGKELFSELSFDVRRERIALQGPNGSGKTTLLRIMAGECSPERGTVSIQRSKIGVVSQHAANWMLEESLYSRLRWEHQLDSDAIASLLVAHKFPLSLAQRAMRSLSPGERLRAALICLFQQVPTIECLLLDEPTGSLDFTGHHALHEHLSLWPGGLVVASHDSNFLDAVGIERTITLGCNTSSLC